MPNLGWVIGEIKNHLYGKRQTNFYHVTKFSLFLSFTVHYFCTKISSFTRVLSIRFVLGCFYLLTFYFAKFSTWIWRLPFAVKVTLNLSLVSSILWIDFSPGTLDFPSSQTQHFQNQIWSGKHEQRRGGELPCALRSFKGVDPHTVNSSATSLRSTTYTAFSTKVCGVVPTPKLVAKKSKRVINATKIVRFYNV